MRQPLLILVTISLLVFSGARAPALAGLHPKLDLQNIGGWSMALGALSMAGYYMYKNSPRERAKGYREELGPGEWYFGGYLGYSYLPPMDWKVAPNGTSTELGPTAKNMIYRPGVQGGLKFGRYLDCLPWFGIEGETNLSRNVIPGPQGKVLPVLPGLPSRVLSGKDYFLVWAMQMNLLARYGFFKDKEVTFGHLQPYVGIGPGWEVVYGTFDSAKNFAIEALGGVRYMFNEKLSIFFEYKYSYQFKIEYQDVHVKTGDTPDKTFIFNFPHHRFVLGVSYHFKNLWGN
jgi:opacity protein-like surface antigen